MTRSRVRTPALRYGSDTDPGYRRAGRGRHVRYLLEDGTPLRDVEKLERIRALAIPPAWTDVWIAADPNAHLQAVGRDARGRKQYRYHPEWRRRRDADKYARMLRFGRCLPRIREAVDEALGQRGMPREKVLALVVRLLELTHLRIGGEAYLRTNRSHGLTTLHDRQATVEGASIHLRFRGKGGKWSDLDLRDRRVAGLIRRVQELPGQRLFEYLDEDGAAHAVDSEDVNEYLRSIAGTNITAKDFRTWAGTVLAFRALRDPSGTDASESPQRAVRRAIESAAERLGNTPAVTRSSYVDPALLDAWQDGDLGRVRLGPHDLATEGPPTPEEEAAVLRLLERRRRAGRTKRQRGGARGSRSAIASG